MFAKLKDGFDWFRSQAFGSDELTAYTAEYTWESNQMAHAMMGFALAVVWLRLAISRWERHQWRLENPRADGRAPGWFGRRWQAGKCGLKKVPVLGPALAWAWHSLDFSTAVLFALIPLKEAADILLDGATFAGSPVQPTRWPLYFDSITDISFWWTGMFLAAAVVGGFGSARLNGWRRFLLGLGGLIACVLFWYLYAAAVWGDQKRTFDQSGLPFNYTRLAVLAGQKPGKAEVVFDRASPVGWEALRDFRDDVCKAERPSPRHYVILGGTPAQRSKLAVSMGCEYALALRRAVTPEGWTVEYAAADAAAEKRRLERELLRRALYVTAAAALERPQLFAESVRAAVLECVVLDDLDVMTELTKQTTSEGSARAFAQVRKVPGLSAKVLDDLKLPANFDKLSAADREKAAARESLPRTTPTKEELTATTRRAKFVALGGLARDYRIGTVWVLAGDRGLPTWPDNRDRWLREIAELLVGDDAAAKLAAGKLVEDLIKALENRKQEELGVIVLELSLPTK